MAELDRNEVTRALHDNGGNISRAAKALHCTRLTLQRRMRLYGIAKGTAGRPKRKLKYARHRNALYAVGAAVAVVAGYAALSRRGSSSG